MSSRIFTSQTNIVFWVRDFKWLEPLKYFSIFGCPKIDEYGGKNTIGERALLRESRTL